MASKWQTYLNRVDGQNELEVMDNDLKPSSSESSSKDQKFIAVEDAFDFGDQMDPNDPALYLDQDQFNVQSVHLNPPWDISNDANMMEQNIDQSSTGKEDNSVDAQFKLSNLFQKQENRRHDSNYKRWQAMKGKCY